MYSFSSRHALHTVKECETLKEFARSKFLASYELFCVDNVYTNISGPTNKDADVILLFNWRKRASSITENAKQLRTLIQFKIIIIWNIWSSRLSLNKVYSNKLRNFHRRLCDIGNSCKWWNRSRAFRSSDRRSFWLLDGSLEF